METITTSYPDYVVTLRFADGSTEESMGIDAYSAILNRESHLDVHENAIEVVAERVATPDEVKAFEARWAAWRKAECAARLARGERFQVGFCHYDPGYTLSDAKHGLSTVDWYKMKCVAWVDALAEVLNIDDDLADRWLQERENGKGAAVDEVWRHVNALLDNPTMPVRVIEWEQVFWSQVGASA